MTVAELLKAANLTQTELSRRFGIPLRTVQQWAEGVRTPPPYVVKLLAMALGIK